MEHIGISSFFRRAAEKSVEVVALAAFKGYWRYQFNRAARSKLDQAQDIMMQTVYEGVHCADVLSDQSDSQNMTVFEVRRLSQKSFVSVLESKRDRFLQNGQGVVYVLSLLEGMMEACGASDPLEKILNRDLQRKLSTVLLDLNETAFDPRVIEANPYMESAYPLAVMEAYPLMEDVYEDHNNTLEGKVRLILNRALASPTLPDILKEQLIKGYARYNPDMSPKLIS